MTGALARWLSCAALLACALLWPSRAHAQLELQMSVSAREVAVGESFEVRLDAMSSDDAAPSSPELVLPNSFEARGPSVGSRQQMSITGFNMVTQRGISASWVVTPTRPGLFTLGPASVRVGGRIEQADTVQIRVLPEGQRPRRRQRRSLDPFDLDPFGRGSFDDLFDRLRGGGSALDRLPDAPPDLVPERAPDSVAFLVAKLDKERAVIGEQVTLSIYAHGSRGSFQEAPGAREAALPDFLAHRLVEDGSRQPHYQYERDGDRWLAIKVREIALFPLREGRLEIGEFEFGFLGRRYGFRDGTGLRRRTAPLAVDVTTPPLEGRPPGYAGDVGNFELTVAVEPRALPLGGSFAVTARVSGSGRLPGALKLPEQSGIEWLAPTIKDDLSVSSSKLGGTRTFSYVVRPSREGRFELGALRLPQYDPEARSYRVALAALGSVEVQPPPPSASAAPIDSAPVGPKLSELVSFRTELGPSSPRAYLADRGLFWWSLGALPLAVLTAAGLGAGARRLRRRLSEREDSPATHARRALGEASRAAGGGDTGRAASALERAVYSALEWATALRARAFMRSELAASLERAGLGAPLAARSVELLERIAAMRLGTLDAKSVDTTLRQAEELVRELVRRPMATGAVRARNAEVRA